MLRRLGLGIATSIALRRSDGSYGDEFGFDFEENEKKIRNDLKRKLNVDDYEWEVYYDCIILRLKKDVFKKYIHELIKECEPLVHCTILDDIKKGKVKLDENFNQENYPLEIEQYTDSDEDHDIGDFYQKWNNKAELPNYFTFPERWLIKNRNLKEEIHIEINYIVIAEMFKFLYLEEENELLGVMNNIKDSYFKNYLAKNMFFLVM